MNFWKIVNQDSHIVSLYDTNVFLVASIWKQFGGSKEEKDIHIYLMMLAMVGFSTIISQSNKWINKGEKIINK